MPRRLKGYRPQRAQAQDPWSELDPQEEPPGFACSFVIFLNLSSAPRRASLPGKGSESRLAPGESPASEAPFSSAPEPKLLGLSLPLPSLPQAALGRSFHS